MTKEQIPELILVIVGLLVAGWALSVVIFPVKADSLACHIGSGDYYFTETDKDAVLVDPTYEQSTAMFAGRNKNDYLLQITPVDKAYSNYVIFHDGTEFYPLGDIKCSYFKEKKNQAERLVWYMKRQHSDIDDPKAE